MSVEYKEYPDLKMVEIVIDGKITKPDFEAVATRMKAFIAQHEMIKILEVMKNFAGFDLSSLIDGAKFDIKHLKNYSHCAIVTDAGWIGPFARLMSSVMELQMRVFRMDEAAQARDWLKSV